MAIACFLLVTRFPELLLRVPFFFRRIADSTRLPAALPYFAMIAAILMPRSKLFSQGAFVSYLTIWCCNSLGVRHPA